MGEAGDKCSTELGEPLAEGGRGAAGMLCWPWPPLGSGVCISSLNNSRHGRRAPIQRKWSHVLLEHPTATAGRKAHGWHSGWHYTSQLCPRSLGPGNSTAPRDHTLGSGQDRSLPRCPKSPQLPVNSLMQAWCKLPFLLAALSLWSLEGPRGGRNPSRLQSKSSSSS